jgi:hypothetical protein
MAPDTLAQAVQDELYAQGDYPQVYFGEMVAAYADEDAAGRLLGPGCGPCEVP